MLPTQNEASSLSQPGTCFQTVFLQRDVPGSHTTHCHIYEGSLGQIGAHGLLLPQVDASDVYSSYRVLARCMG